MDKGKDHREGTALDDTEAPERDQGQPAPAIPAFLRGINRAQKICTVAIQNGVEGLITLWEHGLRDEFDWVSALRILEEAENPATMVVRHVYHKLSGTLVGAGSGRRPERRLLSRVYKTQRHKSGKLYVQIYISNWFPALERGDPVLIEYHKGVLRVAPYKKQPL